jgi:trk system potassium uptake protein TrkA
VNIIIVGAGEVGRHLAESLSSRLHNIILIEQSEALADELNELLDIHILCGNGASVTTLAEANTAECDLFLALSSDDNTNLVSASLAKSLGAKKAIARVHGALQREEWLFDYKAHFKIDYLFSSERLAAVELAKFVRNPECLLVEEIARGRVELQQVNISATSPAAGKTLREVGLPARVRVAAIQRHGLQTIPGANDQLLAGDLVTLFGDPNRLPEVRSLLHPESKQDRQLNVVIFGGGETGCALAQMLESGNYRVRIMELDPKKCRELSDILQSTVVINGDATSLQQLREEQVGQADFFIATSRDDEDNVMTCLQAKSLGTKYTLALIHRADYANVISRNSEQLGIMGAVSPRVATSRDLMRFITSEKFHSVLTLGGGSEVLELLVSEHCSACGRKVSEIHWPEGSGLVAMLRGQESMVPSAEDTILAGDTVYAMVSPSARDPMIKMLTGK